MLQLHDIVLPDLRATVSDFISNSSWQTPLSVMQSFPSMVPLIQNVIILFDPGPDILVWKNSANGDLTFIEAYTFLFPNQNQVKWGKIIWSKSIPPSRSFLTWRLILEKLPTDDNLISRGCVVVSMCCHFCKHIETSNHLFFHCEYAAALWNWFGGLLHIHLDHSNFQSIFSILDRNWSGQFKDMVLSSIIHIIWIIWFSRNQLRFDNKHTPVAKAIHLVVANVSISGNFSLAKHSIHIMSYLSLAIFLSMFIILKLLLLSKSIG